MKKVMIDSSTWVSYLAIDCNSAEAKKLFFGLLRKKDGRKIVVPMIIYLEVINTLNRLGLSKKEIRFFKKTLKVKRKLRLVKTDKKIYLKAEKMSKKVRLKTLDLLILTSALHLKVKEFHTFDKRLNKAYNFMKNYEKNSQKKKPSRK